MPASQKSCRWAGFSCSHQSVAPRTFRFICDEVRLPFYKCGESGSCSGRVCYFQLRCRRARIGTYTFLYILWGDRRAKSAWQCIQCLAQGTTIIDLNPQVMHWLMVPVQAFRFTMYMRSLFREHGQRTHRGVRRKIFCTADVFEICTYYSLEHMKYDVSILNLLKARQEVRNGSVF